MNVLKQPKITKLLIVHLKSTFRRAPALEYELIQVALEDELSYTLSLAKHVHRASEQVIRKADVNEVKYVQVYSNVDGRNYWHFDVYVYAEVDEGSSPNNFIEFWSSELKERAMLELKEQNAMLKDAYKAIESMI